MHSRQIAVATLLIPLLTAGLGSTVLGKVWNENDSARYADCHELSEADYRQDGVYRVYPDYDDVRHQVWCGFEGGEAWMHLLHRTVGDLSFNRTFEEYVQGFGDPNADYFAGLELLSIVLRKPQPYKLKVEFEDWDGNTRQGFYDTVYIGAEEEQYQLTVGRFSGNMEDMLSFNKNAYFRTFDKDNTRGCGAATQAGWWFPDGSSEECTKALPTGHYYRGEYVRRGSQWDGMYWSSYRGYNYSLKSITLKITTVV